MGKHKWYNDQDMSVMLVHYSQNKYRVELPIDNKNAEWMPKKIKNVTDEMKNDGLDCVAIPVNLGHAHWTGLILKKNEKGEIQAHYNDSFGKPLQKSFPKLHQALLDNGIKAENIHDHQVVQQNNSYDCGPWTVFNLDALARGDKLYDPKNSKSTKPDITGQRQKLTIVMKEYEGMTIDDDSHHPKQTEKTKQKTNNDPEKKQSSVKNEKVSKTSNIENVVLKLKNEIAKIKKILEQSVKYVRDHTPHKKHPKKETSKGLKR